MYHEVNTRYNVYFNAKEAYKDNLNSELENRNDNLSKLLKVYPIDIDTDTEKKPGGNYDITVDKTTKAIKLHSITAKPKRDPSKKKSKDYQLWLQQQEFNPFLKNAWLLLGKGEYQNKDYLLASSTFSYIIRLYKTEPKVQMEARIWLAKCYLAMGWLYEAEDIFHNLELEGGVTPDYESLYAEIYADLLIKKKEYQQAIPYIEQAIKGSSGIQKIRLKYILGQVYTLNGNIEMAYKAFQKVQGMNTPYQFTFNAKIQQASLVDDTNRKKVLSELNKMAKNKKNKEYLDQVYYAIGNIHLSQQDTAKAVEFYKKAVNKSTRNGYDKSVAQILLGDIYYNQQKYEDAQPAYSEALTNIDKKDDNYTKVEHRSAILDELVIYTKAIHLQDSLQTLAQMPEEERLKAINKIIETLKKKEKEQKQLTQQTSGNQNYQGNQNSLFDQKTPNIPTAPITTGENNNSFYFYNTQLVEQGKTAFQRKWGSRKQEDNWRRQNKQASLFETTTSITDKDEEKEESEKTNQNNENKKVESTNDPHSVEYYLKQIPLTPQALKKSNDIIEDAYFNSGLIYKDKLDNYTLAIEAFNKDLERFADTPNKEEIYYQLFLIYLKLGNKEMAEAYRKLIINNFTEGNYATTLRNDDYEWNLRNIYKLQDELYQQTYDAYLSGNINQVRQNYQSILEKYPLSELMPKFMYLNALTYAQSQNPKKFRETLSELVDKYPKSDVTPIAKEMLKGLVAGRQLSPDSSLAKGMIWDMKFTNNQDTTGTAGVDFIAKAQTEYLLLFIYPSETVNKNQLIYDIADYNFSKFVYKTFDLSFNEVNNLDVLQVRGFDSLNDISDYIDLAFQKGSLMDHLDPSIITVPISADNYIALMNGKSLNEYFLFFEKNYTKEMVQLVILWNKQREKAQKEPINTDDYKNSPAEQDVTTTNNIEENEETIDFEQKTVLNSAPIQTKQSQDLEKQENDSNIEIGVEDILSDDMIEKADNIINKTADIISNPIDGLKNLFSSSNNDNGMTKEDKELAKQAKKEEKERRIKEKERKKEEEKALRQIEKENQEKEDAYNDSIENVQKQKELEEKAKIEAKKQELKQIKQAKLDALKEKENEKKQRELARKEVQKKREEERKQKERERKKLLKEREQENKRKQREREDRLKQRQEERKKRLKELQKKRKDKKRKR